MNDESRTFFFGDSDSLNYKKIYIKISIMPSCYSREKILRDDVREKKSSNLLMDWRLNEKLYFELFLKKEKLIQFNFLRQAILIVCMHNFL